VEARKERIILQGELPSHITPPSGCPFRTRCPAAMERCAQEKPALPRSAAGALGGLPFA